MIRIAGITLKGQQHISIALTAIYGIGQSRARQILKKANISPNVKTYELDQTSINTIRDIINKEYRVEGDLRRDVLGNIKRLKEIQCYRGIRHSKHLPVRGQRTKTNNRTVRGNVRKTMGSGRIKAAAKT